MLNAGSHKGKKERNQESKGRSDRGRVSVPRPRWPTVRAELLFQKLELFPLDGRCCKNQEGKPDQMGAHQDRGSRREGRRWLKGRTDLVRIHGWLGGARGGIGPGRPGVVLLGGKEQWWLTIRTRSGQGRKEAMQEEK
jgi:hypothetical protein